MTTLRRLRTPVRSFVRKSLDANARTVQTLVTFPERDREDDFVQPDGIEWVPNPKIDWEHGVPIGRADIQYEPLVDKGRTWSVPVGTSHFAQSAQDFRNIDLRRVDHKGRTVGHYSVDDGLRTAADVWEMVAAGLADGVSLDLTPYKAHTKRVGKAMNPISGRYPADFLRCKGEGYAHCVEPVSLNARILKSLRTLPAKVDRLIVAAQSGKVGAHLLGAPVRKSLAPYLALAQTLPRSVRVEKAMNEDDPLPLPPDTEDAALAGDPGDDMGDDTTPTAKAAYDIAQGLLDLATAGKDLLAKGEHVKGRTKLTKLLADLEAVAEEASAIGDMVAGDLSDDEPDGDEVPESEEPAELETEDDGALVTKSLYKPQRFKLVSGVGVVPVKAATDEELERSISKARRALRQVKRGIRAVETYSPSGR